MTARIIIGCVLFLAALQGAAGQTLAPYAGEFLSLGAGARALALGGAYTSLASDATGSYWNPSALASIANADVLLMHEERFAGLLNYDLVSAAFPYAEKASVGVTLLRLGVDGIPDSRNALMDLNGNGELDPGERLDYSRITYFNASDWALIASYAQQGSAQFSYGFSVKVIRRSIAEFTATGIGFDAGALYRPYDNIFIGAVVQDITTTMVAWSTGRTELIAPTLRAGGAAVLSAGSFRFVPTVDVAVRFENRGSTSMLSLGPASLDPSAGLEVEYRETLALRGGISEVGHATVGAGLKVRKLDIDYAYTGFGSTSALGSSHRISLRLRVGEGVDESPGE